MSLFDYFSKDTFRREQSVFNTVAPIYGLITMMTTGKYRRALKQLQRHLPLGGASVLDVGCGTGAWTKLFLNLGATRVVGIDLSEKMLQKARATIPEIEFYHVNAVDMRMFENDSFDIVTSSFVLHGPDRYNRNRILSEMVRVARVAVVIHDFDNRPLPLFTRLLEDLERSHYRDFQKTIMEDLARFGYAVRKVDLRSHLALYIINKRMRIA